MSAKFLVLFIMVLLGSLGIAGAQTELSTEFVTITPSAHRSLTRNGTVGSGAWMSSLAAVGTEAIPQVATGWYFVHAYNCQGFLDGTTTWLYIFTPEGSTWWTNSPGLQNTIAPACQTGNLLAFFVTSTSGAWKQ